MTITIKKYAARYAWSDWFRRVGRKVTLERGKDYQHRTYTMAQQIRRAARKHGLRVSITMAEDEESLTFTAWRNGR